MKAWKHIGIFLVAALVACSCGVSKVKDISLTSVGIQYIVPTSARSMDAKLELGINNPAMGFAVQEVTGTVRYNEKELAHFMTGPLQLEGKSEQVYELPCTVTLAEGASRTARMRWGQRRNSLRRSHGCHAERHNAGKGSADRG